MHLHVVPKSIYESFSELEDVTFVTSVVKISIKIDFSYRGVMQAEVSQA